MEGGGGGTLQWRLLAPGGVSFPQEKGSVGGPSPCPRPWEVCVRGPDRTATGQIEQPRAVVCPQLVWHVEGGGVSLQGKLNPRWKGKGSLSPGRERGGHPRPREQHGQRCGGMRDLHGPGGPLRRFQKGTAHVVLEGPGPGQEVGEGQRATGTAWPGLCFGRGAPAAPGEEGGCEGVRQKGDPGDRLGGARLPRSGPGSPETDGGVKVSSVVPGRGQ